MHLATNKYRFSPQTFSDFELQEAAKMNSGEVPGWEENLLRSVSLCSNESPVSMEIDSSQVVPDLNGNFPSGDVQMWTGLRKESPSSLICDPSHEGDLRRDRSTSLSSWKSCSSLTSGYWSDDQTKSPMYPTDEEQPLSPDRTLIDLDDVSPNVLETLGPTGERCLLHGSVHVEKIRPSLISKGQ